MWSNSRRPAARPRTIPQLEVLETRNLLSAPSVPVTQQTLAQDQAALFDAIGKDALAFLAFAGAVSSRNPLSITAAAGNFLSATNALQAPLMKFDNDTNGLVTELVNSSANQILTGGSPAANLANAATLSVFSQGNAAALSAFLSSQANGGNLLTSFNLAFNQAIAAVLSSLSGPLDSILPDNQDGDGDAIEDMTGDPT